jgi:hypothetical protein
MKTFNIAISIISVLLFCSLNISAQSSSKLSSCQVYLEGQAVSDVSLEVALKWIEETPPLVQCNDGKTYALETFQVSFFTLKPLQNREFGIGQGGFPLRAREAIAGGHPGDAIVLKEAISISQKGDTIQMPVISIKLK